MPTRGRLRRSGPGLDAAAPSGGSIPGQVEPEGSGECSLPQVFPCPEQGPRGMFGLSDPAERPGREPPPCAHPPS